MNAKQKAQLQQITERALKNVSLSAGITNTDDTKPMCEEKKMEGIPVEVTVGLGKAMMTLEELIRIKKGDIINLDKQAGDPVDVYVNNHMVAQGELTLSGEGYGVILTKII